jgi:hypothetical protein
MLHIFIEQRRRDHLTKTQCWHVYPDGYVVGLIAATGYAAQFALVYNATGRKARGLLVDDESEARQIIAEAITC